MEKSKNIVPPPPPSKPPPIKYVQKSAPAVASQSIACLSMMTVENKTYQINVNSPYRADAVATPPFDAAEGIKTERKYLTLKSGSQRALEL